MAKEDSDLLLIQSRLVSRAMELYEKDQAEKAKIRAIKSGNFEEMIDTVHKQIGPFLAATREQDKSIEEMEKEVARQYYERWASIIVEMVPLLADAITLRLQGKAI